MQQPDVCFKNKGEHRLPNFDCVILSHRGSEQLPLMAKEAKLAPSGPLHLRGTGRDV